MSWIIGPTFADELQAAGLTLSQCPATWGEDGSVQWNGATAEQQTIFLAVKAAHDPTTRRPNVAGFKAWLKTSLTLAQRNAISAKYPWLLTYLNEQAWTDFQDSLIAAKTAVPIADAKWTEIKAACATYAIPVTLP